MNVHAHPALTCATHPNAQSEVYQVANGRLRRWSRSWANEKSLIRMDNRNAG